jgi:hypothetical protein
MLGRVIGRTILQERSVPSELIIIVKTALDHDDGSSFVVFTTWRNVAIEVALLVTSRWRRMSLGDCK